MFEENLPDRCPPADAFEPEDFEAYRMVKQTPTESDFYSHRKLYPEKKFNADECRARAVSIFTNQDHLAPVLGLPAHKDKVIGRLTLSPKSGKIKKTGANSFHFSWWVYAGVRPHVECEVI